MSKVTFKAVVLHNVKNQKTRRTTKVGLTMKIADYNYMFTIDEKGFTVTDKSGEEEDDSVNFYPFGSFLCGALNARLNTRPSWAEHQTKQAKVLSDVKIQIMRTDLLQLVLSDRAAFAQSIRKLAVANPNRANVFWIYDIESNRTISRMGVSSLEDLLVLDCCKVLEKNIHIARCPVCKSFLCSTRPVKYCKEHSKQAAAQAKKDRLKNDEVSRLRKMIYDRLLQSDNRHNEQSEQRQDRAGVFKAEFYEKKSSLPREELLEWLRWREKSDKK